MVKIFSNIIDHKIAHTDTPHDNDALIQRIQSLQIYGNEALPFLVQLRAHYKSEGEYASSILDTTNKVISEILKESQLDFHNTPFIGQTDVQLNLRKKSFENYNLTDSYFENVNLYKANFGDATLKNVSFTRVDLQETSFKGANLDSAIFNDANLRKTDFTHAYLYGASFGKNCRHIEDALFTLEILLYLGDDPEKPNPIKSIPNDKYTLLLMKHEKEITTRHEQQSASLKDAYSKLEIKGSERQKFRHLLNLFDQLRETMAEFNDQNRTFASL